MMLLEDHNGQALQDKFVLSVMKYKRNGYFLEIGSNHPKIINNTYIMEKELFWKGIMIEFEDHWLPQYIIERPNSVHIMKDATQINYLELLQNNNAPKSIDISRI